ncbi:Crp/Fnr family transcriptional regulator [Shewanella sp. OMA3-2]|uniref:Crp/Fnr family transcriptional regulator n=1 Tax=Shewanella sp. OMA3-2 TaxID=2908650 RepID=UPI001F2B2B33|nr:Crp/Fnr family transcriptional regulator [Shewanella sp. OMA3-2]UJF20589.1 Crp/Fnr family transcriptional regulator [Shewanella sp. OMA3-2]
MTLDTSKVSIKTSLASCFGSNFQDLKGSHDFLEELASLAQEITVDENTYIFKEDEQSNFVYIPISGVIMLERSTARGSRHVFAFLFTGNLIGLSEFSFYTFSAKSLSNSTMVKINKSLIKNVFERHPQIAKRFHEYTNMVLNYILDQLFIMGQKTAHQRLALFLLDMVKRIGHGTQKFFLPMSRQDIADYLGMSLETTSRGFTSLKNKELISIESNYSITILNPKSLAEYADN